MLTQCPNPGCQFTFDVPDQRAGRNGPCPACGQVITFRSLNVLRQLERQRARLERTAGERGGPSPPAPPSGPLCALLEDVRSLWNVGACFRTADGAGLCRLYLCGITGCPPRKEIAKTSLGAEEHVPWEYCPAPWEVLTRLKQAGVTILGLERLPQSVPLSQAIAAGVVKPPLCLVVGNEVAGVSAETLALCDHVCHLPMRGIKESLNVAVAFGIAAYQLSEAFPVTDQGSGVRSQVSGMGARTAKPTSDA